MNTKTCLFHGVEINLDALQIQQQMPGMDLCFGLFLGPQNLIHVEYGGHVYPLPSHITEVDLFRGARTHREVNERIRRFKHGIKPTGLGYYSFYLPAGQVRPLRFWHANAIGVTFQASIAFRNEEWGAGGGATTATGATPYTFAGDLENAPEVFDKGGGLEGRFHSHGGAFILPFGAPELDLDEKTVKAGGGNKQGSSNEPEFTWLLSESTRTDPAVPLGFTVGNDGTINLWESKCMLYLFRAKVGDTMCGICPLVRIFADDTPLRQPQPTADGQVYGEATPEIPGEAKVVLQVHRRGKQVFGDYMLWKQMRRTLGELAVHASLHSTNPDPSWVLTGTGVCPFPIIKGDVVVIGMDGVGYFASLVWKDETGPKSKFDRYLVKPAATA